MTNKTDSFITSLEITLEHLVMPVLELMSKHHIHDMLSWRCDGEYAPITFWIKCSDQFWWGTADAEDVTIERLPILKKAVEDCNEIDPVLGEIDGCYLFCSIVRKLRPQGCCYPENKKLWPLFDACGPERKIDFGNPYKQGEGK